VKPCLDLGDDRFEYGDSGEVLALCCDDRPPTSFAVGPLQHLFDRDGIGIALCPVSPVVFGEFPCAEGIVPARFEAGELLFCGDMQEELDEGGTLLDEEAFEVTDLLVGPLPGGLWCEPFDPFDEDSPVPSSIEDRHLAPARDVRAESPQKVVRKLLRSRRRVLADSDVPWIEASDQTLDCASLAGCVPAFEQNANRRSDLVVADQSRSEQPELEQSYLELRDSSVRYCFGELRGEVDGVEASHDSIELGNGALCWEKFAARDTPREDDGVSAHSLGSAVEVSGLTKSYGEFQAVGGVDFAIGVGEIFALLGPNGAGKTTIIEILEGYRSRDGGDVRVLGLDPGRDRNELSAKIGIVLQSSGIERYLSVAEAIEMYGSYYPKPRPVEELIELVGLEEKRDARVISLSGGQQRRLDVAIGLVGDPDLVFLDEPTTGFDPSARREAWEMVKNLAALGKTILLTTHYMDEAQYLADRVAVIAAGRFVAVGTPATLAGRNTARARLVLPVGPRESPVADPGWSSREHGNSILVPGDLADLGWSSDEHGNSILEPGDLVEALYALASWARRTGVSLDGLELHRPTLEDVYLELTGGGVADRPLPVATRSRRRERRG